MPPEQMTSRPTPQVGHGRFWSTMPKCWKISIALLTRFGGSPATPDRLCTTVVKKASDEEKFLSDNRGLTCSHTSPTPAKMMASPADICGSSGKGYTNMGDQECASSLEYHALDMEGGCHTDCPEIGAADEQGARVHAHSHCVAVHEENVISILSQ